MFAFERMFGVIYIIQSMSLPRKAWFGWSLFLVFGGILGYQIYSFVVLQIKFIALWLVCQCVSVLVCQCVSVLVCQFVSVSVFYFVIVFICQLMAVSEGGGEGVIEGWQWVLSVGGGRIVIGHRGYFFVCKMFFCEIINGRIKVKPKSWNIQCRGDLFVLLAKKQLRFAPNNR